MSSKQFNTSIKASYRHKPKERTTPKGEKVFVLDKLENNAPQAMSCGRKNFSTSVSIEKAPRIEKDGNHLIRSSWSVRHLNLWFELSLRNKLRAESGNVGRLL